MKAKYFYDPAIGVEDDQYCVHIYKHSSGKSKLHQIVMGKRYDEVMKEVKETIKELNK